MDIPESHFWTRHTAEATAGCTIPIILNLHPHAPTPAASRTASAFAPARVLQLRHVEPDNVHPQAHARLALPDSTRRRPAQTRRAPGAWPASTTLPRVPLQSPPAPVAQQANMVLKYLQPRTTHAVPARQASTTLAQRVTVYRLALTVPLASITQTPHPLLRELALIVRVDRVLSLNRTM